MQTITSNQFQLLYYHYHLLESVEEGIDYVIASLNNFKLTESNRILKDILSAFYHIDSSNQILLKVLNENEELESEIMKYDVLITILEELEFTLSIPYQYNSIIKNKLSPTFKDWKNSIQYHIQPYIIH